VTNPDPFKVEMGNIGQHYYLWLYGAGAPPVAAAPPTPAPVPPAPAPQPPAPATLGVTFTLESDRLPPQKASSSVAAFVSRSCDV